MRATTNFSPCTSAAEAAADSSTITAARAPAPGVANGPVAVNAPVSAAAGTTTNPQTLLTVSAVCRGSTQPVIASWNQASTPFNDPRDPLPGNPLLSGPLQARQSAGAS